MPETTEEKTEMSVHDEAMIRIAEQMERFNDNFDKLLEGLGMMLEAQLTKAG